MMIVLSLGAGVQSTTLALMAAAGEITPRPDCAIFADTGSEPAAVYQHLDWLETVLPFPVHRVANGHLRLMLTDPTHPKHKSGRPPLFLLSPKGKKGMLRRQCTARFKVLPVQKKIRELLGLRPRQWWPKTPVVEEWIGISTDEASRMRPSEIPAIAIRWPLIEHGISRASCLVWLETHGYPRPPKSACTFCPYRSDASWHYLKQTDPAGWDEAVAVDRAVRQLTGVRGTAYLHRRREPLETITLSSEDSNHFENECEGRCGV